MQPHFTVTYELNESHLPDILALFQNEFWTNQRSIEDAKIMLAHSSFSIGIFDNSTNQLVGFARVMTDQAYLGFITDVMCHKDYRKQGIGALLMEAFVHAPQLRHVNTLELYCRSEMIDFYKKWGFNLAEDLHFMRLKR